MIIKNHPSLMIRAMIGQRTYHYLRNLAVQISILFNALLGGELHQSFSARNHQRRRDKKLHVCNLIDLLLGEDHCLRSWVHWKVIVRKI
jgi:hypothetical protein